MLLTEHSEFYVRLLEDDDRTGFKKGTIINPKGVYWNKNNVIVVGDKNSGNTTRISFHKNKVTVDAVN